MNICIISGCDRNDNAQYNLIKEWANYLFRQRQKVTVLFDAQFTAKGIEDGVNVVSFVGRGKRMRGGFSLEELKFKKEIIEKETFDVVYCFASHRPANYFPALEAKRRGAKLFDEWWEWFGGEGIAKHRKGIMGRTVGLYDTLFELPSKKIFDGVICISSVLQDRLQGKFQGQKTLLATGAVDVGNLKAISIESARSALKLALDDFLVGIINLCPEDFEDNEPFLESLKALEQAIPNFKLFCTGKRDYVKGVLAQFIDEERVIYPGWVSYEDYNQYLSACNGFVLPYPDIIRNSARWPNKIGDFLAVKRPVVSNPTGDVKKLFQKYQDVGILCSNTAPSYESALRLLASKPEKYTLTSVDISDLSMEARMGRIFNFIEDIAGENLSNTAKS